MLVQQCPIWGQLAFPHCTIDDDHPDRIVVRGSARAGGQYDISRTALPLIEELIPAERARLTTLLVDQRANGKDSPIILAQDIEHAKMKEKLPMHERASRLLKCLVEASDHGGDVFEFPSCAVSSAYQVLQVIEHKDRDTFLAALAASETIDHTDIDFITDYLAESGWIQKGQQFRLGLEFVTTSTSGTYLCWVTLPGYQQVQRQQADRQISQCFVAMWFDSSMDEVYENGIKPAIEQAGYSPMRIDRKDDLIGKIDDAIIAEIRRSKFMVADFTHEEGRARGGVYYEAGFARGIDIPVIFLCRKKDIDHVHFDTRQFNHILWDSPKDLKRQLRDTIVASMGQGPLPVDP